MAEHASSPSGPSGKALVFSLCLADLRHEWLLSLCMVMAVASVLGPLLILFGLKFGTVETLRERLVRDPRNCEIRPMTVRSYSPEWFAEIAKRPDVAFAVPYTRQLATSVDLYLPGKKEKALAVDAVPTEEGDPLILENGGLVPAQGECLLSAPAAEEMGARAGETVTLVARRVKGGRFETGERELKVTGVLPVRAGAVKAVFVRLPLLEAVENYKDGMAVPSLGWAGELPRAYPVFSSLLLSCAEPLGPELEFRVINNTGFTQRLSLGTEEASALAGAALPPSRTYYLLTTKGTPAGTANVLSVQYLLRGRQTVLFPLTDNVELALAGDDGRLLGRVYPRPAAAMGERPREGLPDAPPWRESLSGRESSSAAWRKLAVPRKLYEAAKGRAVATATAGEHVLSFPVELVSYDPLSGPSSGMSPELAENQALVPLRLLGTLGLLRVRPLSWNEAGEDFLLARRGYSGFRLYASGLEKVSALKTALEEQGITVHTEAERIDDVLRLDAYLSLIFWLIALGSLIGGAACLLSNIYAGIERKRRELAVLRLLGLSGGAFVRFPLYTASMFAVSGFAVAMLLFAAMAVTINVLFGGHLQPGESLCRLAWWHPLAALGLTLGIALTAGGVAARRAISVDPADALRNE